MLQAPTTLTNYTTKDDRLKKQVLKLLGWDELQYGYFMYKAGRNYLIYYTNNDEFFIAQIERNKLFWNWWKTHWTLRNEAFINDNLNCLEQLHRETVLKLYIHTHDARILSNEIYPSGKVLGLTYKKMIGEVIKEEVL